MNALISLDHIRRELRRCLEQAGLKPLKLEALVDEENNLVLEAQSDKRVALFGACSDADRARTKSVKRTLLSSDCNWNAATLANPVNFEGLAVLSAQLQTAGGQVRCFQVPGKGILLVSWRRPDAQVS